MSSPAALATVTATLRHLIAGAVPAASVTTQPPSTARNGGTGEQINIFLYSTHYNTALSNFPMPGEARSGEHAHPPLPLVLKYLITAYGSNDDDISGQQLLGQAMSLLHDHPLLGPSDIIGITPDSDLQNQIERVRITPDPMSLDDMSKLWSSFQSAEYRLSVSYEVSVVLIESNRPQSAALPVLRRGADDRGPNVVVGPGPSISGLRFQNQKPAAEQGDSVTLLGDGLTNEDTVVRFTHPRLDDPIEVRPAFSADGSEMVVQLPQLADDPDVGSKWPAGFYSLSVVSQPSGAPARSSNRVSMPLSPIIDSVTPPNAPAGNVVLTIQCLPQIRDGQRVRLLFGDRTIAPDSIVTPNNPSAPTTLTCTVIDAVARAAPYVLRLRVDGVDSIPVDFSGTTPQFAADQQVTIT